MRDAREPLPSHWVCKSIWGIAWNLLGSNSFPRGLEANHQTTAREKLLHHTLMPHATRKAKIKATIKLKEYWKKDNTSWKLTNNNKEPAKWYQRMACPMPSGVDTLIDKTPLSHSELRDHSWNPNDPNTWVGQNLNPFLWSTYAEELSGVTWHKENLERGRSDELEMPKTVEEFLKFYVW